MASRIDRRSSDSEGVASGCAARHPFRGAADDRAWSPIFSRSRPRGEACLRGQRGWTTLLRPIPPVTSRAPCAGERADGRARAAKRARGPK